MNLDSQDELVEPDEAAIVERAERDILALRQRLLDEASAKLERSPYITWALLATASLVSVVGATLGGAMTSVASITLVVLATLAVAASFLHLPKSAMNPADIAQFKMLDDRLYHLWVEATRVEQVPRHARGLKPFDIWLQGLSPTVRIAAGIRDDGN